MADFRLTEMIHHPIKDVFDYASNLENNSTIMLVVEKVEKLTEGPIRLGSKFIETRNIRGREVSTELEIVEFELYRSFGVKSETNGMGLLYRYTFEEIEEGTQVQFEGFVKTKGLKMRLTRPAIVKMIQKEDQFHLENLKEVLEGKE